MGKWVYHSPMRYWLIKKLLTRAERQELRFALGSHITWLDKSIEELKEEPYCPTLRANRIAQRLYGEQRARAFELEQNLFI